MILYASQRANAAELARHLLNDAENDHVTVHEIRGFVSDELAEALREAYAMSRGTRCRQFLFSVSLNPPEYADVPIEDFEAAIEEIERKLSLIGQPRIIVFHEKNGRRHCHVIWSRIDAAKLIAINMAHFKRKLMEVSRFLFLKHGWKLPKGMERDETRSPWHLSREEYRQSVRLTENAQSLKVMLKSAWERSDSRETFARALQERGFLLARGDKRGFVALDVKGGIYSLTRWLDIGTRALKSRLGVPEELPDIETAKAFLASRMTENLQRFISDAKKQAKELRQPLIQEIRALAADQRQERKELIGRQQQRWRNETRQRASRFYSGMAGIWQRVTGEYAKIRLQNEAEAKAGLERDRRELHALIRSHLLERQKLQKTVTAYKEEHQVEALRLRREMATYVATATEPKMPAVAVAKVSVAEQLAEVQTRIAMLSGNLSMLQSALESNLIPDEMRSIIRLMIERTLETLHMKAVEEKAQQERYKEKTAEYEQKQAQLNEYIRRYAELQLKIEQETRRIEANKQFYNIIQNMSYSLNGVPRHAITVMSPPPERRLGEGVFTRALRQQDNGELMNKVFTRRPRPPVDPETAVPNLRTSVLEVKEVLRRAGLQPGDDSGPSVKPKNINLDTSNMTIKFNTRRQ